MTKTSADYPARWYATMDKPCAYYDTLGMSNLSNVPDASAMFALTEAMWEAKGGYTSSKQMYVDNGTLVDYVATTTATGT